MFYTLLCNETLKIKRSGYFTLLKRFSFYTYSQKFSSKETFHQFNFPMITHIFNYFHTDFIDSYRSNRISGNSTSRYIKPEACTVKVACSTRLSGETLLARVNVPWRCSHPEFVIGRVTIVFPWRGVGGYGHRGHRSDVGQFCHGNTAY